MTGHGIGMKIGMMTKDGVKMIGLVQLLMTLTGPMMIGHGVSQIGMPGMMIGPSETGDDSQTIAAVSTGKQAIHRCSNVDLNIVFIRSRPSCD